jgi:hypothetical protein
MVLVRGELGEFVGLGAVLGDQFGEPALDGLTVFAGGAGVVPARVADGGLGCEFGDQGVLAPFDVADLLAQLAGALGCAIRLWAGGVAGELRGQQLEAGRPEDALGEEAVHHIEQDVLADPQAGRVTGLPGGALGVVALVGFVLLLVAARFDRALLLGDPGQLDPFSIIETPRWIGLPYDPMQNAVTVLQAHNPDLPVHRLPVSWRLPASAAPVVFSAFYPFSGFRAATTSGDRQLEFRAAGIRSSADATLDLAARSGWALHVCPGTTRQQPAGIRVEVRTDRHRLVSRALI